ncbi:hypothetical protein [Xylanimonas ulmi]|uniref:Uncharacterized protein n=1 Tax=Xylanimonas ulmi TaxID=228973 RepID=A0A4Q7MAG9_9MICO|nr:hypothetical protein [Xylanibacterium ulmi]RZS63229.1 hypothetical protein EV386_3591 [Xylanibacterium ulmi]
MSSNAHPTDDGAAAASATTPAPGATVATARRIHLSEDWAATIIGLALVALGLLSLLPEGLVG